MDFVASSSQPFSSQEGGELVNEERQTQEGSRDKAKKMGTKQKKERSRATEKERNKKEYSRDKRSIVPHVDVDELAIGPQA